MSGVPFGEQVRKARTRRALTQGEVAERLGVTAATVSNWENDKSFPDREQRDNIRRILGMGSRSPSARETSDEPDDGESEEGPSAFGAWLNRTRVEKKLSVAELAEESKLSIAAIYNIEAGRIANPRTETVRRLERALGVEVPSETKDELQQESNIEGVGELVDFDPHDEDDLPDAAGVYVLYDISERPVYVGEGASIRKRIRDHGEKFWFKQPIVETGAYVKIDSQSLRKKVEMIMIRFLKSNAVINKKNVDR